MRGTRVLEGVRHLREIAEAAQGRPRIRLLRRSAVCDRPAALRTSAGRHDQGRGSALPDHARQLRRAFVRLGLPRAAGRERDGKGVEAAEQARHRGVRRRQIQRGVPFDRAALHVGVGDGRDPHGPLGRFPPRLPHHGPQFHGVGLVGVQGFVGQGAGVRRLQDPAVLSALRDAAVELRDESGVQGGRRPGDHDPLQAAR